jgi:hypothetical protein
LKEAAIVNFKGKQEPQVYSNKLGLESPIKCTDSSSGLVFIEEFIKGS